MDWQTTRRLLPLTSSTDVQWDNGGNVNVPCSSVIECMVCEEEGHRSNGFEWLAGIKAEEEGLQWMGLILQCHFQATV